jgi:predicted nucleic acid-binding protein
MTNDSIIAATALEAGIHDLASADRDFERLQQLKVYAPLDLP